MRRGEAGFTYLGLMIALAVIGVAAAGTLQLGAVMQRRTAEEQLLDVGTEIRAALKSYGEATPSGLPRSPRSLQELVRDPRFPNPRRYLRKLYPDPMTGSTKWGLMLSPEGFILGVYSLSREKPIKVANFPQIYRSFTEQTSYAKWVFTPAQLVPVPPLSPADDPAVQRGGGARPASDAQ